MTGNELQIDELNAKVKVRIAPSPVHGVGVFAIRDICKGTRLYADEVIKVYTLPYSQFSKLFPEIREILLERWPSIVTGSRFAHPDTRIQAYINHDDDPNYDGINDVTLRDIAKGEEVFEDYRKISGWDTVFPWLVI